MIVADSSVWIDHFNGEITPEVRVLRRLLWGPNLLVGDLILHEVARGESDDATRREVISFMRRCRVLPMLNTRIAILAADNFQRLRKEGVTPETADLIIATFCIAFQHRLLYADSDFAPMKNFLNLQTAEVEDCVREQAGAYELAA